ncbi:MAG: DedA family protein [Magnetococcales bacterium]|nr:DedA family protein [Magnetococcales bacterium]
MDWGLSTLFTSAFLAATILPLSSEAVMLGLFYSYEYNLALLWGVATVGNVAGSMVNWYLGRYCLRYKGHKWFPVTDEQLQKAQNSYLKWGQYTLLLAWVPVIGDPLTFVAGLFRTPFYLFTFLVFVGKGGRYLVFLWLLT